MELRVCVSEEEWVQEILGDLQKAIGERISAGDNIVHVLLSGGTTPLLIYSRMTELNLPWEQLRWWLADERCVHLDNANRNELAIKNAFGAGWERVRPNFMSWGVVESPDVAARAYDARLRAEDKRGPVFSIFLAGVGDDGHTASLFPDSPLLQERAAFAAATSEIQLGYRRLSLTPVVLERAARVLILLRGNGKAAIAERLRTNDSSVVAARVFGERARVLWLR